MSLTEANLFQDPALQLTDLCPPPRAVSRFNDRRVGIISLNHYPSNQQGEGVLPVEVAVILRGSDISSVSSRSGAIVAARGATDRRTAPSLPRTGTARAAAGEEQPSTNHRPPMSRTSQSQPSMSRTRP